MSDGYRWRLNDSKFPEISTTFIGYRLGRCSDVVCMAFWESAVKIIDNSDITVRIQFIVGGTLFFFFFCGFPSSPMVHIVLSSTCGPQTLSYGHNPKRLYLFTTLRFSLFFLVGLDVKVADILLFLFSKTTSGVCWYHFFLSHFPCSHYNTVPPLTRLFCVRWIQSVTCNAFFFFSLKNRRSLFDTSLVSV